MSSFLFSLFSFLYSLTSSLFPLTSYFPRATPLPPSRVEGAILIHFLLTFPPGEGGTRSVTDEGPSGSSGAPGRKVRAYPH